MKALLAGSLALVAYVIAGYPAIAALLARRWPLRSTSSPAHLRGSASRMGHDRRQPRPRRHGFVILAYNEAEVSEAKLQNVAELDYPPDRLEIIVVTDGSDDATLSAPPPCRASACCTARSVAASSPP